VNLHCLGQGGHSRHVSGHGCHIVLDMQHVRPQPSTKRQRQRNVGALPGAPSGADLGLERRDANLGVVEGALDGGPQAGRERGHYAGHKKAANMDPGRISCNKFPNDLKLVSDNDACNGVYWQERRPEELAPRRGL
jgi:hypothetical protein